MVNQVVKCPKKLKKEGWKFFQNAKLALKNFTNLIPNISFLLRFTWRILQYQKSKTLLYYGGPLWPVKFKYQSEVCFEFDPTHQSINHHNNILTLGAVWSRNILILSNIFGSVCFLSNILNGVIHKGLLLLLENSEKRLFIW